MDKSDRKITTVIYDAAGRVTSTKGHDDVTDLPYSMAYDSKGRLVSHIVGNQLATYRYSETGRLRIKTSPEGKELEVWDGVRYIPKIEE